jgi:hypothetical protein
VNCVQHITISSDLLLGAVPRSGLLQNQFLNSL